MSMTKEEADEMVVRHERAFSAREISTPWSASEDENELQESRAALIQALTGKASLAQEEDYDLFMGRPIPEAAIVNLKEAMDLLADECAPKFKMVYNRIVHAYSHINGFDHEAKQV